MFDELLNFPYFEREELRAFYEFLRQHRWKYRIVHAPWFFLPSTSDFAELYQKDQKIALLVGGLEHFLCFHILGMSSSQLTFTPSLFQRGRSTTNQMRLIPAAWLVGFMGFGL